MDDIQFRIGNTATAETVPERRYGCNLLLEENNTTCANALQTELDLS